MWPAEPSVHAAIIFVENDKKKKVPPPAPPSQSARVPLLLLWLEQERCLDVSQKRLALMPTGCLPFCLRSLHFFSTLSQVLMPAHNGDFHVGPFGKYFFYNDVHRERDFSAKGEWEEGDSLGRVKALLL